MPTRTWVHWLRRSRVGRTCVRHSSWSLAGDAARRSYFAHNASRRIRRRHVLPSCAPGERGLADSVPESRSLLPRHPISGRGRVRSFDASLLVHGAAASGGRLVHPLLTGVQSSVDRPQCRQSWSPAAPYGGGVSRGRVAGKAASSRHAVHAGCAIRVVRRHREVAIRRARSRPTPGVWLGGCRSRAGSFVGVS
jgi:hypothetical protein